MKKFHFILLVTFIAVLFSFKTEAQSLDENKGKHYSGIGGGIGFVNPKKINEKIENFYRVEADIFFAFNAELNMGYYVTNEIEIKGALSAAAAFSQVEGKDMIGMANNKVNLLTRLAPEIIGNYYFALDYYRSLYIGGGFSFNILSFFMDSDNISDSGKAPGLVINVGLLPQNRENQTYLELKANLIRDKWNYLNFSGISLNYGIRF